MPRGLRRMDPWSLAIAATAVVASAAIARGVLDGIPHISDEIAYTFQARILFSGAACLPGPEMPALFAYSNMLIGPARWCSIYPPGWPLLLGIGDLLGTAWLVSPILFGVCILLVSAIGRRLFDRATGVVSAAALAMSPFALMNAAGQSSHVAALCACLACLLALVEAMTGQRRMLILAGALGGAALLIRPATAVALLAPTVVWCLWSLRRTRPSAVVHVALGFAPMLALYLCFQAAAFGSAFTSGYVLIDPAHPITGSGARAPSLAIFAKGLPWYLGELGRSIWSLPGSDWLLPALGVLLPGWLGRSVKAPLWLAACALSLIGAHALYDYHDVIYGGPPLAFEALGPLCLLAGHGVVLLWRSAAAVQVLRGMRGRALGLAAAVVLIIPPLGLRLPSLLEYHRGWYGGQSPELLAAIESAGVGDRALIIYQGPSFGFGSLLLANELEPFSGDRVHVRDVPRLREGVLARAGDRERWRVRHRLEPLPGANTYTDRWKLRRLQVERIQ